MNPDVVLLGALLVPVLFVVGALSASRARPFVVAKLVSALAAVCAVTTVVLRSVVTTLLDAPVGVSLLRPLVDLDVATSVMLVLVSALAVVIVRYSERYLNGERHVRRYERALLWVIASVVTLVTSNHLAVIALAWIATSLSLHQLLVFYGERRQALVAAHKKFLLSRLADVCIIAALVLTSSATGSLRIDMLNAIAATQVELPASLQLASCLLAMAVILKSAQLPFHGWMTQVMEAPTPVSALLHAGVVNIGGFLMIRLSPLVAHSPAAQALLLAFGLATSCVASLVLMTRVSIKVSLAWSTIAQMGFMLVQCGLGAWHLALLHLVAHSLYKAYAFLAAGTAVQVWQRQSLVRAPQVSMVRMAIALAIAATIVGVLVAGFVLGGLAGAELGPLALIMTLSLAPLLERALGAGARVARASVIAATFASVATIGWHATFAALLPSTRAGLVSPAGWWTVAAAFAAVFTVQSWLRARPTSGFTMWLAPRLFAGFNLDEWFTRMTFRIWSPGLARTTTRLALRGLQPRREVQL